MQIGFKPKKFFEKIMFQTFSMIVYNDRLLFKIDGINSIVG